MPWDHRVVRTEVGGEIFYSIHEAYYTTSEDKIPHSITELEVAPNGESLEELEKELERYKKALAEPVLTLQDGKVVEWTEPDGP